MLKSNLILDPQKRSDVWRYLTYQFLHAGFPHIFGNLLMQLFLGIPLELVHGTVRVGMVYTVGVTVGPGFKYYAHFPMVFILPYLLL